MPSLLRERRGPKFVDAISISCRSLSYRKLARIGPAKLAKRVAAALFWERRLIFTKARAGYSSAMSASNPVSGWTRANPPRLAAEFQRSGEPDHLHRTGQAAYGL
jgi:hypothetical protein